MRRTFGIALLLSLVAVAGGIVWKGPKVEAKGTEVKLGSATWTGNLKAAQQRSMRSGKPVLLLDMIGRLDEKWC